MAAPLSGNLAPQHTLQLNQFPGFSVDGASTTGATTAAAAANLASPDLSVSTTQATEQNTRQIIADNVAKALMTGNLKGMTGAELTNAFLARKLLPGLPDFARDSDDALAEHLFANKGDRLLTLKNIQDALAESANPGVSIIQRVKNSDTGVVSVLCQISSNPGRGEIATTSSGRIEPTATALETALTECREEMNGYGSIALVEKILSGLQDTAGADIRLLDELPKTQEKLLDAIVAKRMGFFMVYVAPKTIEMSQVELDKSLEVINSNVKASNPFNKKAVELHLSTKRPNLQAVYKQGNADAVEKHPALQGENLDAVVALINQFFSEQENLGGVNPEVFKNFAQVNTDTPKMQLAQYLEIICDATEMKGFALQDAEYLTDKQTAWADVKAIIKPLKKQVASLNASVEELSVAISQHEKLIASQGTQQTQPEVDDQEQPLKSDRDTQEINQLMAGLILKKDQLLERLKETQEQLKIVQSQISDLKTATIKKWGDDMNLARTLDILNGPSVPKQL